MSPVVAETESHESQAELTPKRRDKHFPRRTVPPGQKKAHGLEARIRQFSPAWFSVTMGSGIPSTLLNMMPWTATHAAFRGIGAGFLIFDMCLFATFAVLFITRYILYPQIFPMTLRHNVHALFIGTIPMGFVTLCTCIANYGQGYHLDTIIAASVLYWIAMALALFSACIIPYMMMTIHNHSLEGLTATWLLPFVPPLTIAASGATMSNLLMEDHPMYAFNILIASYIMLGIGMCTAFSILVLYLQRLLVHHLPGKEVIISTFLPLGPTGQAGYAAIQLGYVAKELFPILAKKYPEQEVWIALTDVGPSLYGAGILIGLVLFGYGFWYAFMAIAATSRYYVLHKRDPQAKATFSLGYWAVTFPTGSLNLLTYSLATAFDNMFLKVLGTILTACVCIFWLLVIIPTIRGFKRGTLFEAPCLNVNANDTEKAFAATAKPLPEGP